jgi:uncharacterized membrane protein YeiH
VLQQLFSPSVQHTLDLVGIFVFAISGALLAVRKNFDVFGIAVLAEVTALGGGLFRDLIIGAVPPAAFTDLGYFITPLLAALLVFFLHPHVERIQAGVNVFDAAGLGLFCVTGALKSLEYGLGPVPAALMGVVTGIGGGMARDLLAGRTPIVFSGELYATPALAGATWAVLAQEWGQPEWVVALPGVAICFGFRMLALWRGWQAPLPRGPASV